MFLSIFNLRERACAGVRAGAIFRILFLSNRLFLTESSTVLFYLIVEFCLRPTAEGGPLFLHLDLIEFFYFIH